MNNTTNKRNTEIGSITYATKFATNAKPYEIFMNKSVNPPALYYKNGNGGVSPISTPTDLTAIQNDLTALEATVNALPPIPTPPTTTVISITSTTTTYDDGRPAVASGILGMGSSPIKLLPAPGTNKYYDVEKMIFEFDFGSIMYVLANSLSIAGANGGVYGKIDNDILVGNQNLFYVLYPMGAIDSTGVGYPEKINKAIELGTVANVNPTSGNGTLRVIITYTVRTFGV